MDGGAGDDVLVGGDGADVMHGGADNDSIDGSDNPVGTVDQMFGDAGTDTLIWSPGKDDDFNDGGDGTDTSIVNGGGGSEVFLIAPTAAGARLDRTTNNGVLAPFFVDMANVEILRVNGNAGNDNISGSAGLAGRIGLELNGGAGDDVLVGGDGADDMHGGDDNDTLDGSDNPAGTFDAMFGDVGDDTLIWNPGKDDDINEGGPGQDTSIINGGTGSEDFVISPNGGRVLFQRTNNNGAPLPFSVGIGTTEVLRVNGNDGADTVNVTGSLSALISLEMDGGNGADVLNGSDGADLIQGGAGADTITAKDNPVGTTDRVFGGDDDDVMIWNPGEDDDVNDGGAGRDTTLVLAAGVAETFDISQDAAAVSIRRELPTVFEVSSTAVEVIELNAGGGDDAVRTDLLFGVEQVLSGGTAIGVSQDSLRVRGFQGNATFSPVLTPEFGALRHEGFEAVEVLATGASATATLDGAQEVPPVDSLGQGRAKVVLSSDESRIQVDLSFVELGGTSTMAHIHGPAQPGANAPPLFTLVGAGGTAGEVSDAAFDVTPQQVAELKAGLWYVNVHSTSAASGEIRGQLRVDRVLRGPVEARQVVPGSTSQGRGYTTATLAGTQDQAVFTLAFADLIGENGNGVNTSNVVHAGGRGAVGPAIQDIDLDASETDKGELVSEPFTLTPAQALALGRGSWYVEVNSEEFPQGEIRGQLVESVFFRQFRIVLRRAGDPTLPRLTTRGRVVCRIRRRTGSKRFRSHIGRPLLWLAASLPAAG